MLGNDVVDLTIDDKKYLNQRFINRVLTDKEKQQLSLSQDKNTFLWSLWAIKEASYKACQKLNHPLKFSPIQFEPDEACLIKLNDHRFCQPFFGTVQHKTVSLKVKLFWQDDKTDPKKKIAVHATAIQESAFYSMNDVQVVVTKMNRLSNYKTQSFQVRKLAKKIMLTKGIKATIQRPLLDMDGYSKPGPPILVSSDQSVMPHEISLSHDHEWLAVALLIKK